MRHPILYADQHWRRQRVVLYIGLIYAVVSGISLVVVFHTRVSFQNLASLLLVFLLVGVMIGIFQLNKRRSYLEVRDDGLRIQRMLSSHFLSYDKIRAVRVLPLRAATENHPRLASTPPFKPLLDHPSVHLRLAGEPEEIAALAKRLNGTLRTRLVFESTLAVPVPDAQAAAAEISPHLPQRMNANLGGARRPRRRR